MGGGVQAPTFSGPMSACPVTPGEFLPLWQFDAWAAQDYGYRAAEYQLSLHPLKGNRSGIWSISVSGNWRVTFEYRDGNAYILNYEDYH